MVRSNDQTMTSQSQMWNAVELGKCSYAAMAKLPKNESGLLQYAETFNLTLVRLEISSTKRDNGKFGMSKQRCTAADGQNAYRRSVFHIRHGAQ